MESLTAKSSIQSSSGYLVPTLDGTTRRVDVSIEKIGPEKAKEYLEANTRNRPLSKKNVRRFAKLIEEGRWFLTQDAIAFDLNGELINGQNRLHAIVESGTQQHFIVVRGLDPECFQVMDYGKKRSAGDALAVRGYKNYKKLASVARLLWQYENGSLSQRAAQCENMDIVNLVERHPDVLIERVSYMTKLKDELAGWLRPRHLGFVYYVYSFRDEEKARDFAYSLAMRTSSRRDCPVRRLYIRLMDEMQSPDRMDVILERALVIKAANKYMNGEDVKTLRWSPGAGESFPSPDVGSSYPFNTQH